MGARLLHPVKGPSGSNSQVGGPYPWQQNQLTNAHYHKGSHPIEDAQVLDTEDHMVQEECHQATEADAGDPEEGKVHCAGQAWGMERGTQQNTAFQCLWPRLGPASHTLIPRGTFTTPSKPSIVLHAQRRCRAGGLSIADEPLLPKSGCSWALISAELTSHVSRELLYF